MQQAQLAANPFALMMNPEAIFAAIADSERLGRLHSRICRPLDKPMLGQAADEVEADDASIEDASIEETAQDSAA